MHIRDVPTSVISKIHKLLRLAERKHGAEAKVAQAMAEKLMDKWGIEVDSGPETEDGNSTIVFAVEANCVAWRYFLASAVGRIYNCTANTTNDANPAPGEPKRNYIHISGLAIDMLPMRLHYRYLETEIERMVGSTFPATDRHVLATGAASYVSHLVDQFLNPGRAKSAPPTVHPGMAEELEVVFGQSFVANPFALAKIPRTRVRASAATHADGHADPNLEPEKLDVDLPLSKQLRGVERANRTRSIANYATRLHESLDIPIASAAIGDKHVRSVLRDLDIRYVGELVEMRRSQLIEVAGLGRTRVMMLEVDLSYMGLHLRPEPVFVESVAKSADAAKDENA